MDMDSGTAVRIFVLDIPVLSAHPEFGDAKYWQVLIAR